jgi:multidrug efflux pump
MASDRYWQIGANDQARTAADYAPLIVRYRKGQRRCACRRGRGATDSVQDVRNYGVANGKPAILLLVFKQPGANIIERWTGARLLPQLRASIPAAIDLNVVWTAHPPCAPRCARWSALAIAVGLVILVVFLFLRNGRATLIPAWPCRCRWRAPSA